MGLIRKRRLPWQLWETNIDSFVVQVDGYYYMTYTTVTNITLLKNDVLT